MRNGVENILEKPGEKSQKRRYSMRKNTGFDSVTRDMEVIPEQPDAAPQEQVVVHELRAALATKDATIAKLQSDLERIKAQLEKQLRARFGKSSEVIDPATLLPFAQ